MSTTSTTSVYTSQIDALFPIPGQDNDTQTFRDNFGSIKQALFSADSDIHSLKLNAILTTGTNNFNYGLIKNAVFQGCSNKVLDNSETVVQDQITVDFTQGSYQKFSTNQGTTLFTVINWPGSASNPLAAHLTLQISAGTVYDTQVILPGEYINQGPIQSPFVVPQTNPIVFDIWNDGVSTFVKPLSEYPGTNLNTSLSADYISVLDAPGAYLKIRNNYYTTGTNDVTVVYNTGSNAIGNLAVVPNIIRSTFTATGLATISDGLVTTFLISNNASQVYLGANIYTTTTSVVNTVSNTVTHVSGNQITVTPGFSSTNFNSLGGADIYFKNPEFTDQPSVFNTVKTAPTSTLGKPGDSRGQAYVSTAGSYLATAAFDGINNIWTTIGMPMGTIVMWYGATGAVPLGWQICDGTNGTPDMRGAFPMGVSASHTFGTTGGSADAVVVSHTHDISPNPHSHSVPEGGLNPSSYSDRAGRGPWQDAAQTTGDTSLTVDSTGVSGTNANLPPYVALYFIMKVA